jgi:mono/diheme cytochrome c family protein
MNDAPENGNPACRKFLKGRAVAATTQFAQGAETDAGEKALTQVRKPRQGMPPYSEKHVSNQDVADIYHYLFSTKPSAAAKDVPLLKGF